MIAREAGSTINELAADFAIHRNTVMAWLRRRAPCCNLPHIVELGPSGRSRSVGPREEGSRSTPPDRHFGGGVIEGFESPSEGTTL